MVLVLKNRLKNEMKCSMNAKAVNILYCGVNADEFNRISTCKKCSGNMAYTRCTSKSKNQVKELNINLLGHKYKLFKE